jgi:hypothetical protein
MRELSSVLLAVIVLLSTTAHAAPSTALVSAHGAPETDQTESHRGTAALPGAPVGCPMGYCQLGHHLHAIVSRPPVIGPQAVALYPPLGVTAHLWHVAKPPIRPPAWS